MELTIIIPVFNEIGSLEHLVKELKENLKKYISWEVIFIDDGSSDGSTDLMISICQENQNFKLIQFYCNYGKSAALN